MMQFEIETTEEKLKEHFERDYRNLGLLCLFMYTAIVFTLCFQLLKDNFFTIFQYYLVGLVILAIFLFLLIKITTKLSIYLLDKVTNYKYGKFTEIINETGITEILDDDAETMRWDEVGKVVLAHKFIIIKPKNRKETSFIFKRSYFDSDEEYEKVVKIIQKYYKKTLKGGSEK